MEDEFWDEYRKKEQAKSFENKEEKHISWEHFLNFWV